MPEPLLTDEYLDTIEFERQGGAMTAAEVLALVAALRDARRALDEIRPVVEYVDNEVTYDGSWGEILMEGIKRIEAGNR